MDVDGRARGWTPAWLETLKKVRGIEWIVLLIAVGAALALAAPVLFPPQGEEQRAPPALFTQGGMEEKLARILSSVEGAGKVEVFIAYDAEEAVPASKTFSSASTDRSERVKGVIVVAEGASDVALRLRVADAVRAALDIPISRVEVLPMKATEPPLAQGEE